MAERSTLAMTGTNPAALVGRPKVDLDGFEGRVKWVHVDPPVFTIDGFLTEEECEAVLRLTHQSLPPDAGRVIRLQSRSGNANNTKRAASSNRFSTTWYVRYACAAVQPLLRSLSRLLPTTPLNQVEEVQLVQYLGESQGFGWHTDSLSAETSHHRCRRSARSDVAGVSR
mmetsp:Transcript_40993/g.49254  ORF Transcript_40993/g.49254 Transcript_40993/m.49254 type:complete len:170 (+) Transcript_40993:119-628(+)